MATGSKIVVAVAGFLFALYASAEQQFVYPAKGQSSEQQKRDEYECHQWAVRQTGFDPAAPQATTSTATSPATTPSGTTPGAGVRGAVRGAIVGEIVGGDAGTGALAGAVGARSQSRRQNVQQSQQATRQKQQVASESQRAYGKARAACLEGRGYTVK